MRHSMLVAASILFASAVIFASCSKSDDPPTSPPSIEPKLSSIQQDIFTPTCATAACHDAATQQGGLNLTAGSALGELVNVRSEGDGTNNPKFFRVQPGNVDSSFLYIKINGPDPNQGDRMPQGGARLSDERINAIRTWIQNGAPND